MLTFFLRMTQNYWLCIDHLQYIEINIRQYPSKRCKIMMLISVLDLLFVFEFLFYISVIYPNTSVCLDFALKTQTNLIHHKTTERIWDIQDTLNSFHSVMYSAITTIEQAIWNLSILRSWSYQNDSNCLLVLTSKIGWFCLLT